MADPTPATSPDLVAPATPSRTFWQRRVRDPIVVQLTQGMTPEKLSLTIAAGSACALFPVFGVTSMLCFVVALILRLNQPIMQLLNQLLLPVHIGTFMLCVRLGEAMFQVPFKERLMLSPRQIHETYFKHFWAHPIHDLTFYVTDNADSVAYSIVAWAVLVLPYSTLIYFTLRPIMRGIAKVKAEVAAKDASLHPEHPIP